ncbi:helix-turn-helix domain-containing protein [Novosphingobium mangrovi (ex Huang et al. 2023)]|uniref:Helix-turn-helix domain-containing protein n=1 Tax=Novosphingobium mangrovi (ex Huang et al. 2023) TaxID=2976432 RepID=A0ABT2I2Y9_9SPHN|nr:helix-turn-helix domain-containing protein [Novosphingobium mangrovi (ex Huang et al. 2023)]MCT2399171.1 helix-turn-helix domain-containing protein [Novosphingobium mangrovi (ex Huang et al. 2023)]
MNRRKRPAFDTSIAPEQGVTKDGQPLSYNRAPAPDLAPWIGRLYVTKVEVPADYTLSCGLFNDTACIRIQLAGDWTAETATGPEAFGRASLFFGPQTRRMPVSVTGSFISVGFVVRPGACTALRGPRIGDFLDRLVPTGTVTSPVSRALSMLELDASPEEWLQILEGLCRKRVEHMDGRLPDPIATQFEEIAFSNPSMTVSEAAERCGVERRKLERVANRDFGMPPKQVLRRARALDMASQLRGVADSEEGSEMALRYYDESHLIHEFTELFGMSPRQFAATPQPIMTLALESRQARRLEALKRLAPGEARPWE